ncbi:hypothetical protein BGZ60DRAFT_414183 [Tricladium varicosporioides]|nr:hypothetical protein BGZ60DRAFT_414183 [Hymenoscyphus varicosporioides]
MRLINVESMKMEEFSEAVPPYAILSHRWDLEEVTLQEWNLVDEIEIKMQHITAHDAFKTARHEKDYYHGSLREQYSILEEKKITIKRKAGYAKIVSLLHVVRESKIRKVARHHSCHYVWIDTCCIDKTNNAELSEAINSMFRWYKNALVCYVYLADVSAGLALDDLDDEVRASNWFERGWTLQELLAPRVVVFFDQGWNSVFDKQSKAPLIAEITRINEDFLSGRQGLSQACTARKMSWAATRKTTRREDLAYCLLGIFDVNIPLLYGEGERAFVRLQEEIIRQSGDLSIFAWGYRTPLPETSSIFAHSPADFIGCFDFMQSLTRPAVMSMTNVTLSVELSHIRPISDSPSFIYADLKCFVDVDKQVFLPLVAHRDKVHPTVNVELTKSIWFERRLGARPILINKIIFCPIPAMPLSMASIYLPPRWFWMRCTLPTSWASLDSYWTLIPGAQDTIGILAQSSWCLTRMNMIKWHI